MYITMVFFVRRAKLETKKLLIISTLIIVTGLITHVPDQLLITFKVSLPSFNLQLNNEIYTSSGQEPRVI